MEGGGEKREINIKIGSPSRGGCISVYYPRYATSFSTLYNTTLRYCFLLGIAAIFRPLFSPIPEGGRFGEIAKHGAAIGQLCRKSIFISNSLSGLTRGEK